jgi:DNA-binding HxlR family transcriptional regulator
MLANDYPDQVCSVARGLEVVGERWTLLILRDVFAGRRRFDDLVESLGITRTVLTNRLRKLVEDGVLERHCYQRNPERYEYHPTEKGRALFPVIAHLMQWGDRYYPEPAGPPRLLLHRDCGGRLRSALVCEECHRPAGEGEVEPIDGPGAAAQTL